MQRLPTWKQGLRALAGLAAGVALWIGFSPVYRSALITPTELLLHLTERPDVTDLAPDEDRGIIVNRSDFAPGSPRPGIPTHDLTFNVVLLLALFAMSREPLSNANAAGLGVAMLILWLTHILALTVRIKRIYAFQLGEWSTVHYGAVSRNVWGSLDHFYRVIGMFAIAFALWWIFRGDRRGLLDSSSSSGRRRRGRRRSLR